MFTLVGGHPIVHSSFRPNDAIFPHPTQQLRVAYVQGKGSVWLPPTLAAIISKRKKVAGAAATTRHATNSSHGEGGIMWKCREAMCHLNLTQHYQFRWRIRNEIIIRVTSVCGTITNGTTIEGYIKYRWN